MSATTAAFSSCGHYAPVDPAQLPRMKHHERRNVAATPSIICDTAIATKKPIANEIIKTPSSIFLACAQ